MSYTSSGLRWFCGTVHRDGKNWTWLLRLLETAGSHYPTYPQVLLMTCLGKLQVVPAIDDLLAHNDS